MSKNTGTSELINYFDLGVNGDVGISGNLTLDTITNATTDTDTFLVSDTGIIKYRTGAQLLSDIGAQGLLTNPVTGTGTSGTIPVFTGSTTIGNSIIKSNSTEVNIVGNGSQLLFDSLGSARDGGIQYVNDFTLQMYNSRGVGSSIYLGNNNLDLNINPSSNPRLRITSGGNVLVNTTTDSGFKLDVNGTGRFSGDLTGTSSTFSSTITSGGNYLINNPTASKKGYTYQSPASNWGPQLSGLYFTPNNAIDAQTTFTVELWNGIGSIITPLSIASTGAATFSSSVRASSLALSGTISNSGDAATLTIKQASTTFTNGIYLERAGERNGYYMYVGGALDALTFRRNYFGTQSDVMSLTRDGNVGIGTASPAWMLEINKDTASSGTGQYPVVSVNNPNANGFGGFYFYQNTTQKGGLEYFNGNNSLIFVANSAERMRITSGGNVLIGTSTDNGNRLQVNGDASFAAGIVLSGTTTNFGAGTGVYTRSTWYNDTSNQILFENARQTDLPSGIGRTVYFTWRGGPSVGGGVQLQHGTNAWAAYTSDARLKTKVSDIENGIDAIMKLTPIKFKWSRELENSRIVTGFTAQNVGEAIPDAVFNSWKDVELGDVKSYYQDYLIPYLVKAIQEQQEQIDKLKNL